jgi:hypothetical protein
MSRIGHDRENCTANLMQGQEAERVPSIGDGAGSVSYSPPTIVLVLVVVLVFVLALKARQPVRLTPA